MSHKRPTYFTSGTFRAQHVDQKESPLQQLCVSWFRLQYPNLLLYAIPNGGKRSKIEAAIMNGEGVTPGVPDLFLAYPVADYCGLYIEMKTAAKNSKPSDDQIKIQAYLTAVDYAVIMPRTFEEFQQQVTDYLTNTLP